MKLDSQCFNMQSTLEIAQKFLGTEIKIPQQQVNTMLDLFDQRVRDLESLIDSFNQTIHVVNTSGFVEK